MMHATTFSYARDTEIPPSIVKFSSFSTAIVDPSRSHEQLILLCHFPGGFVLFLFFKNTPEKWRMLNIGFAVNNRRETCPLTRVIPSSPSCFHFFISSESFFLFCFHGSVVVCTHRMEVSGHATSYSEWNGLFWK